MAEVQINWPAPPPAWSLGDREVHVWAINLRPPDEKVAACARTLAADETQRAERFRFERDRRRFIVARGSLRAILCAYLERVPARIAFDYSSRGKPALAGQGENTPLHFNLSHSDELALLAVTRVCPLGIDLELIRPLNDADAIADRFFSARESQGLAALPPEQKPTAFFNLWTRKEAWLKATGDGISESLDKVEVSFLADEPARLISLPEVAGAVREWGLFSLSPNKDFVGALAIRATDVKIDCRFCANG
jgi:4'-phosphopantetheinyl transferase